MRSCLFSSVMIFCVSVREPPLLWVFLWVPSSDTEDLKVGVRGEERRERIRRWKGKRRFGREEREFGIEIKTSPGRRENLT